MPPIYFIEQTIAQGGAKAIETRLIDAKNQAQAIGRVIESSVKCSIVTHQQLIDCTKAGIEVEKA